MEAFFAATLMLVYAAFVYYYGSKSIEKDVANEVFTRVFVPIGLGSFPLLAFGINKPLMLSIGIGFTVVAYASVAKANILSLSKNFPLIPKTIVQYGWIYNLLCVAFHSLLGDRLVSSALLAHIIVSPILFLIAAYQLRRLYGYHKQ